MRLLFILSLAGTAWLLSCADDDSAPLVREGVFLTGAGPAQIEGELFLPEGDGPFPSMIIVPGSGNESRVELETFADILNPNGYALYIYDKRGIGNSTGSYPPDDLEIQTAFIRERALDVLGIIDLLMNHELIDPDRIGLYGSSQGAWVNSKVYEMSEGISYLVMASGGVASGGLERYYCGLTDDANVTIDEAISQLADYDGALGYDPLPIVRVMDLPALWIYGNEDRSHPARYDLQVLEDLNKENFTVHLYENTDHELLDLVSRETPGELYMALGVWLLENN